MLVSDVLGQSNVPGESNVPKKKRRREKESKQFGMHASFYVGKVHELRLDQGPLQHPSPRSSA